MTEQHESVKDRFWEWYSEAWEVSNYLREQLRRVTEERDNERKLRQETEATILEWNMSKRIDYDDISEVWMTEQHECKFRVFRTINRDGQESIVAYCVNGCSKRLETDEVNARLNEYETLKAENEGLRTFIENPHIRADILEGKNDQEENTNQ